MTKHFLILLFFLFLQHETKAAETQYLIYSVNKEVHRVNNTKKEKAVRGMFLSAQQSIIISALAEVMLIQNDGKSMLLNKPGTYSYIQVKKLFNTAKPGGMSKFFSYVFEKFLSGTEGGDEQKVSAAVFRGKVSMTAPTDSSFIFSFPLVLHWKPEQKNLPYKLFIRINELSFDTTLKNLSEYSLKNQLLNNNEPVIVKWLAIPKDSRQAEPIPFVYLVPAKKDITEIKQQMKQLSAAYSKNQQLLRLMKNDLLEQWIRQYKLK
ncbi:MAG: hypothetical protein QM725_17360 [Lacibacter sp.]